MLEKVIRYIEKNAQPPIEYCVEKVSKSRIIILGEDHVVANSKRAFGAKLMPHLARSGCECLAVEVDSSFQPIIDNFLKGSDFERDYWFAMCPEYLAILYSARDAGMHILCIDNFKPGNFDSEERDIFMQKVLIKALERFGCIAVWIGSWHARKEKVKHEPKPLAAYLKKELGKGLFSIEMERPSFDSFHGLCELLLKANFYREFGIDIRGPLSKIAIEPSYPLYGRYGKCYDGYVYCLD